MDLRNKDSVKQAISAWIVELGELDSTFRRSDVAVLKAFLSQPVDELRIPYAQKSSKFARRTSFIASVNDLQFLVDESGNRRFIPLSVTNIDVGWSDEEICQIWAEAFHRYCASETWWPSTQEEESLAANAEKYRFKSAVEEGVEAKYDWSKPPESSTKRYTATEILEIVLPARNKDPISLKTVGTTVRRLWMASQFVERRGSSLFLKEGGSRLNSEGGVNRGWLMPPVKENPVVAFLKSARSAGDLPPATRQHPPQAGGDRPQSRAPHTRRGEGVSVSRRVKKG